jgi:hypothetical protein
MAAGLAGILRSSSRESDAAERYYRAVLVLQRMGGPAAQEEADIPRRIAYTDAAESLLHHPDKIFVLGHVAEELAQVRREFPRAAFFEACARLALGDRREAARLLTDHVIASEYNAGHYALLCRLLHELGEYSSLLLICREWAGRDPSCRAERIRSTWTALHHLERYDQAAESMLAEEDCLGWRAPAYAAKSLLDSGKEREAARLLENALARHAGDRQTILLFWERRENREWF